MSITAWYPGERVARLRASHSYGFVLVLILATFLFAAASPNGDWTQSVLIVLETATLAAALWTAGFGRAAAAASAILAGLAVVGVIISLLGGRPGHGGIGIVLACLMLATCAVIARGVADQRSVNAQSILGAISIYILLGLVFTTVYGAIAELGSGDLFAQGTDGTLSLRLYFSYVTLATVGYGDYTTSGQLAHTVAITEALVGQLYLVTVLAVLVARLGHRRSAG
jgi:hypothetical protein